MSRSIRLATRAAALIDLDGAVVVRIPPALRWGGKRKALAAARRRRAERKAREQHDTEWPTYAGQHD